jgi:hypothetical protein
MDAGSALLLVLIITAEAGLIYLFYFYLHSMHKSLRTIAEKVSSINFLASAPQAVHAGYTQYPGNPGDQYKV